MLSFPDSLYETINFCMSSILLRYIVLIWSKLGNKYSIDFLSLISSSRLIFWLSDFFLIASCLILNALGLCLSASGTIFSVWSIILLSSCFLGDFFSPTDLVFLIAGTSATYQLFLIGLNPIYSIFFSSGDIKPIKNSLVFWVPSIY